ncbi:hypothetical protein [Pseudomonas phage vB_PaS_IME307]|nr:hypothetical protein [Pseudomonas phage vB_PaS_IME307]
MTDINRLKVLAERALGFDLKARDDFYREWTPKAACELIAEVERLRSRLEIDERIPHDGISCRDETIKVLDEKCDKLKAENESLLDELSACTEHPGGCGYWREAAKRRTEERDQLKAENDALREALSQISNASCSDARSVVIARTVLTKGTTK